MSTVTGQSHPVRQGVTDTLPVIAAYIPFGLTVGAAMAAAGVAPLVAWASSPLMFGGAGQLLAVQLLGAGANAAVVVLGALVVNARFLLYSASLAGAAAAWPRRHRFAAAALLADPVYALATARFTGPAGGGPPPRRMAYYFAVGITLYLAWQILTGAGVLLAGVLPAGLRLDLAAPLTFLLLLLPMLTGRTAWVAAAAGGTAALAASGLPLGLGVLVGATAGITAGTLIGAVVRDLLILVVIGLGTYALRAAFLVTARPEPPAAIARLLPPIGPAVIAAIAVPALLAPHGSVSIADTVPALVAAAVAGLVWRRTRSMPLALFAALGTAVTLATVLS